MQEPDTATPQPPGAPEVFSTASVDPSRRMTFWNELASATFSPMTVDPASGPFSGRLVRRRIGEVGYARVASSPASIHARPAADEADSLFLLLQSEGTSRTRQCGREVLLLKGQASLCLSTLPYVIEFDRPNVTTVVKLPACRVRERISDPERLVGRVMAADRSALLAGFLSGVAGAPADGLQDGLAIQTVSDVLVDLVGLAFPAETTSERCSQAEDKWRKALTDYTRRNLGDPDLGAAAMARAFDVTPRYVQMIFAGMGMTCSAFILEQRLISGAAQLRRGHRPTITALALDLGFNDPSHFGRTFRRRYGVTPSRYRRVRGGVSPD